MNYVDKSIALYWYLFKKFSTCPRQRCMVPPKGSKFVKAEIGWGEFYMNDDELDQVVNITMWQYHTYEYMMPGNSLYGNVVCASKEPEELFRGRDMLPMYIQFSHV